MSKSKARTEAVFAVGKARTPTSQPGAGAPSPVQMRRCWGQKASCIVGRHGGYTPAQDFPEEGQRPSGSFKALRLRILFLGFTENIIPSLEFKISKTQTHLRWYRSREVGWLWQCYPSLWMSKGGPSRPPRLSADEICRGTQTYCSLRCHG